MDARRRPSIAAVNMAQISHNSIYIDIAEKRERIGLESVRINTMMGRDDSEAQSGEQRTEN